MVGKWGAPQLRFEDPATTLVAEARALLEAAERREPVPMTRARVFARACLEMTEFGRAAIVVIDGDVFAGARLVELAERVCAGRRCRTGDRRHEETVVKDRSRNEYAHVGGAVDEDDLLLDRRRR